MTDARAGEAVEAAAAVLRRGGLVVVPTETVYGLACDAVDAQAVARLYAAKGRPSFNPLIVHVADLDAAQRLAWFDAQALSLAQAFWPGPLTLVAPTRDTSPVCDLARAGLDTVAVRVPAHPLMRALLLAFDSPVVAPSANRSGRPSPTSYPAAMEETGGSAEASLDGGLCTVGLESTVLSVQDGRVRLLRPGGLERAAIEALVGAVGDADADAHRSPGRLMRHYAPDTPIQLDVEVPRPDHAYLAFGPDRTRPPHAAERWWNLSPTGDLREAAANLFRYLRAADRVGAASIAVAPIPEHDLGEAINDRLRRAAGFVG